jgi:HD-like signal output (HDOD) protein
VQVLRLVDDPDVSAQQLARAVATDPVLAARVLRVANSPYYGLGGRVGTLPFAVSVVGFQAVRSLAVVAAAGLDDPSAAPEGFWRGAALVATAAELLAPLVEADPGDAFSLGLLHTLGAALLHQRGPGVQLCLPQPDDARGLLASERERFGETHDELAARALATWHMPARLCELIARHHEAVLPDSGPLERSLHVARLIADHVLRAPGPGADGGPPDGSGDGPQEAPDALASATADRPGDTATLVWLTEGRIAAADVPHLVAGTRHRAGALLQGLPH